MPGSPKKRARREAAARAAAEATKASEAALPSAPVPIRMKANAIVRRVATPMTEELFTDICDRVANGSSLVKLAKEEGMPSRTAMQRWIDATEERREVYEQARKDKGDYRSAQIDEIVAKIEDGTVEANAGRVMIEAIKWQASKENPRAYGDKVELTGKDGAPLFPELVITFGSTTIVKQIMPDAAEVAASEAE